MADDQETPLHRYIGMVKDMQSYLDYTIEMEKLATQMNACGKQTKTYASLSFRYDTYRVARETYWAKMAERYGVADVEALAREMRALEPELSRQVKPEYSPQPPPKRPLRDLYGTEEEDVKAKLQTSPKQRDESERCR